MLLNIIQKELVFVNPDSPKMLIQENVKFSNQMTNVGQSFLLDARNVLMDIPLIVEANA